MTNNTIFVTQIVSVVVFFFTLFGLYRILISQKDATIQLLKEKCDFLAKQLEAEKQRGPDQLADSMAKRIVVYEDELARLNTDKEKNSDEIRNKSKELDEIRQQMNAFKSQIEKAKELVEGYSCPDCNSPIYKRKFHSEVVELNGYDAEIDHVITEYDCGCIVVDGEIDVQCPEVNRNQQA